MNKTALLSTLIWLLMPHAPAQTVELTPPDTAFIPAGDYISGSTRSEKEYAYSLDEKAYGHSATRQGKWYENERPAKRTFLKQFRIMLTPVTNSQYAKFIQETGHAAPQVSERIWQSYGLIHAFKHTHPYQWRESAPPRGRQNHPVTLVSQKDAKSFAKWLSLKTGKKWRLPTASEWEKAARGQDGRYFPWGNKFDGTKLNSHDKGHFGTTPVGHFPEGASPYGMLDAAGQVFEWTSTPSGSVQFIVKGGSWDDKGCGVCRPAASHSRPEDLKHILIGFRLVQE